MPEKDKEQKEKDTHRGVELPILGLSQEIRDSNSADSNSSSTDEYDEDEGPYDGQVARYTFHFGFFDESLDQL